MFDPSMPFHCRPIAKANQNRLSEKFFANWEPFPVERIFRMNQPLKQAHSPAPDAQTAFHLWLQPRRSLRNSNIPTGAD
jgi:hypothetical protein